MRLRAVFQRAYEPVRHILEEFARHRGGLLAAALAYHTLLCMAPLVILAVGVAGIWFGRGTAHAELQRLLQDALGPTGAGAVDEWVVQASQEGEVAGLVGLALILLAASKLGGQLRHILNQIWDIGADPFVPGLWAYVRRRLFAVATAAAVGPLLLVLLISRTLLTAFHVNLFGSAPVWGWLTEALQITASILILAGSSAAAFRFIPDARSSWRSVWVGGAVTALLVGSGNALAAFYFGRGSTSPAEAAGSGVILLLWVYFSSYIFLLGAEFTRVLARREAAPLR